MSILIGCPGAVILTAGFLHSIGHGDPLPGGLHVNDLTLIFHIGGTQRLHADEFIHLFHHFHAFMVVGEGLVGFHGSELRVMGGIHALIAEDTADLIDPFKTADDQTLEIELCLNAQEHIQIQRVVMGAERACTCTDFHCLKNRGIHLKESAAVKELTDSRDDRASLAEHIANLGIDNRIHIALTITEIRVGQAMEFFGQHFQEKCKKIV